ncbi:MAG: GGDEF domain-containing protein [Gammaproteobacteria bacterium]|nr:GGDEF domain-containing protein [Gammaproteobacteria bacterium]
MHNEQELFQEACRIAVVAGKVRLAWIATVEPQTQRKEKQINYLAHYDSLTGIANRTLFCERLTQHVRATAHDQSSFALCVIDLDHSSDRRCATGGVCAALDR